MMLMRLLPFVSLAFVACEKTPPPSNVQRAVRTTEAKSVSGDQGNRAYSGTLEPKAKVELSFRAMGTLRSVLQVTEGKGTRNVQEGDFVKKGQILGAIDDRDLRHQFAAATSGLTSAEAEVLNASTALRQADTEFKRARDLFKQKVIAAAEFERAESAFNSTKARFESATALKEVKVEQRLIAARALEDARLLSPIDGVLARKNAEVGSNVAPGSPVFTVIDVSQLRFTFSVPDNRIQSLKIGDRVPLNVEPMTKASTVGVIAKIFPVADPLLRTFTVEVAVPNEDRRLKAGMVASAYLSQIEPLQTVTVPLASVVRSPMGEGYIVYVVDAQDKRVHARPIKIQDLASNNIVVEHGLTAGDRVIVEGASFVRENDTVEIVP